VSVLPIREEVDREYVREFLIFPKLSQELVDVDSKELSTVNHRRQNRLPHSYPFSDPLTQLCIPLEFSSGQVKPCGENNRWKETTPIACSSENSKTVSPKYQSAIQSRQRHIADPALLKVQVSLWPFRRRLEK